MVKRKLLIFLTAALLFVIGGIFTLKYVHNYNFGLNALFTQHRVQPDPNHPRSVNLLKGDIFKGEILSAFPKFNAILFRFHTHERINTDIIRFRIKEEEKDGWFYSTQIETKMLSDELYIVGFPPIEDSAKIKYQFELESLNGTRENSVSISYRFPTFVARHAYTITNIKDIKTIRYFVKNKLRLIFNDPVFFHYAFIYFLPLFYLVLLIFKKHYHLPALILFLLVIKDISSGLVLSDYFYVSIFFIWLVILVKYSLDGNISLFFALIFFITAVVLAIFKQYQLVEQTASWVYLFLAATVVQKIYGKIKPQQELVSLSKFVPKKIIQNNKIIDFILFFSATVVIIIYKVIKFLRLNVFLTKYVPGWEDLYKIMIDFIAPHKDRPTIDWSRYQKIFRLILVIAWVLLGYLLITILGEFQIYQRVFFNYFPEGQNTLFIDKTAKYLFILYASSALLLIVLSKIFKSTKKVFIALAVAFIVLKTGKVIFEQTTTFKNQVVLWSARVNDTNEAWVDVFVKGQNLKNLPFKGKVYVDGNEQRIIRWSDKEVIFRTNPLLTKSGKVEIVTYDGQRTNSLGFSYVWDH